MTEKLTTQTDAAPSQETEEEWPDIEDTAEQRAFIKGWNAAMKAQGLTVIDDPAAAYRKEMGE